MTLRGRLRSWFGSRKSAPIGQLVAARQGPIAPPGVRRVTTRHTDAEALLLSRFLVPNDITDVLADTRWASVLSEPPEETLSRFRAAGLLGPASLSERRGGLSESELKDECRKAGLKASGRKEELAERISTADVSQAEAHVADRLVLRVSEAGALIAREFTDRRDAARTKAQELFREHFAAGRFDKAVAVLARFEASGVFPRGMGSDWAHYDVTEDAKALEQIANGWPKLVDWVPAELRSELRALAADQYIWGRSRPFAQPPELEGPLPTDVVINMLVACGTITGRVDTYCRMGASGISLLCSGDACPACKKAARVYRLSHVPEIPVRACTGETGCRCSISPKFS